jgi:hypothetical protein
VKPLEMPTISTEAVMYLSFGQSIPSIIERIDP